MLIIPAAITTLALIAHTLIGTQEALSTSPQKILSAGLPPAVRRNWMQNLCAFQMVTIDLLLMAGLLTVFTAIHRFPSEKGTVVNLIGMVWAVGNRLAATVVCTHSSPS